jgi:hypothetical protein
VSTESSAVFRNSPTELSEPVGAKPFSCKQAAVAFRNGAAITCFRASTNAGSIHEKC